MIKRIMRPDRSSIAQLNPTPISDLSASAFLTPALPVPVLSADAFTPSPWPSAIPATPPPGTCQTEFPTQARRYLAWTEHRNSGRILATRLTSTCEMMPQLLTNSHLHWQRPRRAATLTLLPAIFFLSSLQAISLVHHDSRMHATDHTTTSLQSEKSKGSGVQNRMIAREFERRSWHALTVAHGGTRHA